jgi:hypothetical protein
MGFLKWLVARLEAARPKTHTELVPLYSKCLQRFLSRRPGFYVLAKASPTLIPASSLFIVICTNVAYLALILA